MKIEKLSQCHVEDAASLVLEGYLGERESVGILPLHDSYREYFMRELAGMAGDGVAAVAAVEHGRLAGFLAGYPVEKFFSSRAGVYVPLYGHGAAGADRRYVYQRLYAEVSGLWVREGRLTHCVSMFAHDATAVDSWYWLGFGLRCVDAIRPLVSIDTFGKSALEIRKALPEDAETLFPLHSEHCRYYRKAPLFMPHVGLEDTLEDFRHKIEGDDHHLWAAYDNGKPISYMRTRHGGETFVSDDPKIVNICSAFTAESARGTGAGAAILAAIVEWAKEHGCERLGVDYESFNIFGSRFWMKHFTPFMFSAVRCIDDRIIL